MNKNKKSLLVLVLIFSLLSSTVPAFAGITMNYDEEKNVQLFTGTFRDWYVEGQNVTLFVLLWRPYHGPISNATVTLIVEKCCRPPLFEINVTTDENGMATAVFTANSTGYYTVIARYGDNEARKGFRVITVHPYYFITKRIVAEVNRSVSLLWTLMDPFTRQKYTSNESINVTILKDWRAFKSALVTPTSGVVNYTTVFPETGMYQVELDGRYAATVYVTKKILEGTILAPKHVRAGASFTAYVLAVDPENNEPYSGNLTVRVGLYTENGSQVREIPVRIADGYGAVNITTTKDTLNVNLVLESEDMSLDYEWVEVYGGSSGPSGIVLAISPKYILAKPGQSVSVEITSSNVTTGEYNMTVVWYPWAGTDSTWILPKTENVTKVYFNNTDRVIKRIEVPENAYYGVVTVGSARAYIYTMRPKLHLWCDPVPYTYNSSTHSIEYERNVTLHGYLKNETKDWMKQWEELYYPLPNQTVYIYSNSGVYAVKTDENGHLEKTLPYVPNPRVPRAFGEEMDRVWYLMIHKSGAYDVASAELQKVRVKFNLTVDGIHAFKYLGTESEKTPIPVVIEFARGTSYGLEVGDPYSLYWNTSELNITKRLEPGKYKISILPSGWLCGSNWCSSSSGLQHSHIFVLLPPGIGLRNVYSAADPNNITIPIKLPGKGLFYFRDWSGYYYIGTTDENGNGLLHLPWKGSNWNHYHGYFGFITENVSIINIPWWFAVHITRDVLPPAVEVSVTPEIQEIGKNVTISYVATDDNGLGGIEIEISNITDVIYNTSIPLSGERRFEGKFNFTVTGLEDYIVKVTAYDLWNHSSTEMVNFFGKEVSTKTVKLSSNGTVEINVENQTSIKVSASENSTVQVNVTVSSAIENESARFKMRASGYEDLKYVKVDANETVNYRWVILNLTYNDEVLRELGIDESAVTLFYWNGSEWIDLSKHVGDTIKDGSPYGNITVFGFGKNREQNYVWANVSHLSEYALAVKLPDLRVVSLSTDQSYAGRETTVRVEIENTGGGTTKEFTVALIVNGNVSKVENVTGLEGGQKISLNLTWIPPAAGTYTLKVVVDYNNVVYESNETNNNITTVVNVIEWTGKPGAAVSASKLVVLNFLHYRYYLNMKAKFERLYNQSVIAGVDNSTLAEALKHAELAEEYYRAALRFGPIVANLGDPRIILPLRKAYLEMRRAVEILEKALEETKGR